ncbi:MAG: DUF2029 domain-containing protein [Actinobacteria bacterium]|nr:DUF2029 domain-containing protein [Actinomycetota bacterium]
MTEDRKSGRAGGTAIAVALVFAIALVFVVIAHSATQKKPKLNVRTGAAAVVAQPELASYLRRSGWNRTVALPLDERLTRVSFLRGRVVLLDAAVAPDGEVPYLQFYRSGYIRAGSQTAQSPLILAGLCLLFALMTITLPLRRIGNLDVLALVVLALTIHVLNLRLFEPSLLLSTPALLYLIMRCAYVGFHPARIPAPALFRASEPGGAEAPVRPIFTALTGRLAPARRDRLLALVLVGLSLMTAMLVVPGGSTGDVGLATMSGATALTEGKSPYRHVTEDVVHGDTYPFFMYLLYAPVAAVNPVHDAFDNLDGALWPAVLALALAGLAIFKAAGRAGGRTVALRQTLAWLAFAPVLVAASAGSNDLAAAALVAWAVAWATHAGRSSLMLAAAAWAKVIPVLALPLWLLRFRSDGAAARRAVITVGVLSVSVLVVMLAYGGPPVVGDMLQAISFQASRGSLLSTWTLLKVPALQAVFLAAVLTLAMFAAWRTWRDRSLAVDHRRICALAAAAILGMQLAANYWSYAYLPWVYPLIAAALLWPVACDEQQTEPQAI